ncbi:hypothetical protein BOTNAR_0042g00160 [Botryotinia narcissicola]|uniref:O-methyltransferase domain-containing protein n=1 Tax=Botryotinia narcissicola TaxID=278944 RepID=A0A4Z1J1C3_9HELO|nr:hypothetical protein BOTNAR_0042g00160 [Botryotinia narcissicola]
METLCDKVQVFTDGPGESRRILNPSAGTANKDPRRLSQHYWVDIMDKFAPLGLVAGNNFLQANPDENTVVLGGPIRVALIDDGIDITRLKHKHNGQWQIKYIGSAQEELYVLKLNDHLYGNKRQIEALSAAQTIREAVAKDVHIIFMSWTIPRPDENRTRKALEAAISEARQKKIPMFCSASDGGPIEDKTFPWAAAKINIFRIDRILRHFASTYTIREIAQSAFTANETTRSLASPAGKVNIVYGFNTLNKAFQELPDFLKENSPVSWTSVVPLVEKLREADPNVPLFVDIGGGHGYQCDAFRKATTEHVLPGRVVLKDLPGRLAEAPKYKDIEMIAQDFYEKQQIQGAKQVPQHIKDAMSPKSILLIDEIVIPDTGASPFSTQLDFTMMAFLGSTERTITHWRELLGDLGFELAKVHPYDTELEYSILEAVRVRS